MKSKLIILISSLTLLAVLLSGCDAMADGLGTGANKDAIQASGVIEALEISVASEISGRVAEVHVVESDQVSSGDLLFELEDDLLLRQRDQAQAQLDSTAAQVEAAAAAVNAAEASLKAAELSKQAAEVQYKEILAAVFGLQGEDRVADWNQSTPSQIDLPAWYFQQTEQIEAAEKELAQSREFYQDELDNYRDTVSDINSEDLLEAETRLAEAQAAFEVADTLNDRKVGYEGREEIEDFITTLYEKAESELEAAQKDYNQILADPEYEDILEARARVSVAKERFDLTRDYLYSLYTGEYAFEVQAAEAALAQAEAGVLLAEAQIIQAENNQVSAERALSQSQAALEMLDLQIEKLKIVSPISGTILNRTIDPAEILTAGYTAITIGDLSQLTVTVYLPEDRYGQIELGSKAELTVDSFPDLVFDAQVMRIADQAEYTPRNVQTQEERQNTVYAVELSVTNLQGKLKPGMPADVVFLPR